MGRRVGGRLKREEMYVYMWPIHIVVQQKLTQHCKAIVFQLKTKALDFVSESACPLPISRWNIWKSRGEQCLPRVVELACMNLQVL